VVEDAGVGRVVMRDQDDGVLGVGGSELRDHGRRRSAREHAAQGPAPRGEVVDRRRAGRPGERRADEASPTQRRDPGRDARARRKAERPPEGAVNVLLLDPGPIGAELAQAGGDPFGRHPLTVRCGGPVDRGEGLHLRAQPGGVRCGACRAANSHEAAKIESGEDAGTAATRA
jgi:hypothetical protein